MVDSKPMKCPQPGVWSGWLSGEGPDADTAARLEAHLQTCPKCAALLGDDTAVGVASPSIEKLRSAFAPCARTSRDNVEMVSAAIETGTGLFVGSPFAGYDLLELLGKGGFGVVYRARKSSSQIQHDFALKIFPRLDSKTSDSLQREIEAFRELPRHDNLVNAWEDGQHDGRAFIVMEYVAGPSLKQLVDEQGPLSVREACCCGIEIAKAIRHFHEHGRVHRDIKPGNIAKTGDRIVLLDLGLTLSVAREADELTRNAIGMGTPGYVAPEQCIDAHSVDVRADIYSLGCTLTFLLCGQTPQVGEDIGDIRTEAAQRLGLDLDPIPKSLRDLLERMHTVDPQERTSDPDELIETLQTIGENGSDKMRSIWPQVVGIIGVLALVITMAWWVVGNRGDSEVQAPTTIAGMVDALVWDPNDTGRQELLMNQPRALPLRAGDGIRIRATLDPPAYPYIVWIDPDGSVTPIYPWSGDWSSRRPEKPVTSLSLPDELDTAWPLAVDMSGVATVVLCARSTRLPLDFSLLHCLSDMPAQLGGETPTAFWTVNGAVVRKERDQTRAPVVAERIELDDAARRAASSVNERLADDFSLIVTSSFTVGSTTSRPQK